MAKKRREPKPGSAHYKYLQSIAEANDLKRAVVEYGTEIKRAIAREKAEAIALLHANQKEQYSPEYQARQRRKGEKRVQREEYFERIKKTLVENTYIGLMDGVYGVLEGPALVIERWDDEKSANGQKFSWLAEQAIYQNLVLPADADGHLIWKGPLGTPAIQRKTYIGIEVKRNDLAFCPVCCIGSRFGNADCDVPSIWWKIQNGNNWPLGKKLVRNTDLCQEKLCVALAHHHFIEFKHPIMGLPIETAGP